jgi:zinc protease
MTSHFTPSVEANHATQATNRVQHIISPQGIEAWLVEDYTVPLLALEFCFQGGAAQDESGKAGAGNLLSGLLDEGAGEYDSNAFQSRIEDLALDLSFSCDRDYFGGTMKTLIKHRDAAFDMLRLTLNEAHIEQDAIDRVKAQIVSGLKHEEKDPNSMASKAWGELAFANHAYGLPTHGTYESLEALTRNDLLALRARLFAKSNLKIAVVGAIDAKTLGALLDKTFASLTLQAQLVDVPFITPQHLGTVKFIELDVPQSVIKFGSNSPLRTSPNYMPSFIINHVLGGGVFSARLFKEVREKRGLAYSVYSSLNCYRSAALFIGATATKNERAKESLDVIQEQIADLAQNGPTSEELINAKKYLTGSYPLRFDTSSKIAGQLVQIQNEGLGIDYIDRRNSEVDAVTPELAKKAAADLLGSGKLLVTVVGQPIGF